MEPTFCHYCTEMTPQVWLIDCGHELCDGCLWEYRERVGKQDCPQCLNVWTCAILLTSGKRQGYGDKDCLQPTPIPPNLRRAWGLRSLDPDRPSLCMCYIKPQHFRSIERSFSKLWFPPNTPAGPALHWESLHRSMGFFWKIRLGFRWKTNSGLGSDKITKFTSF